MMMETIMSRSVRLVFAGGAALGIGLLAQPAFAQQADTTTAAPVQRVEITGSNIRRVDAETPSPVQVITADDMKKSGYTSVADIIKNITANGAGQLTNSNPEAFAGGASGVALRGLSVGATLTLIDGHRMAPYPLSDDGQRQFVDISSIPFDIVDRIEVLKDGASAVYGSDAIAGVVNVILKKSFQGTTISAEGGGTQQGGGANSHVTFTQGFGNLDEDGYTGYLALEYRKSNQILMSQRPESFWNSSNPGAYVNGANNWTPGYPGPFTGGFAPTLTPYFYNVAASSLSAASYQSVGSNCSYAQMSSGACTYTNTGNYVQPPTENKNIMFSFTKRLSGGWELNTKASIFDSLGSESSIINLYNAPLPSFPGTSYGGATTLNPANNTATFNVGMIPTFTVPANYPGVPAGWTQGADVFGAIPGVGYPYNNFDTKSYRLVTDLTGTIGAWDITASLGYTKADTVTTYTNVVNMNALYNALQLPSNNIGFFNVAGGNSAYVMNNIAPSFQNNSTSKLMFAEATASRSLMALQGGDLGFATGVQFVHKALDNPLPWQVASGSQPAPFNAYAIGQENDASVNAEIYAPITKTFEVDASARADDYDTYGTSVVPQVGFKWSPSPAFALRGTAGEGFRAPNTSEIGGHASAEFGLSTTYSDPVLCPMGFTTTCGFAPAYIQTTTAKLNPEKSKTWTLGTVLEPIKGWSSTIDYYSIEIKDQIVPSAELAGFVPDFIRGAPQSLPINGGFQTTPVGVIQASYTPYVNANTTKTSGIELETQYKWKMGSYGSLTPKFDFTHMINYILTASGQTYSLAGTHGPNGVSGDTGNPKNRAQFSLGYDKDAWNVTANANWIDSYGVTDPSAGNANTCSQAINAGTPTYFAAPSIPTNLCTVGSFMTVDLTTRYVMKNGWTLHAGILNALDRLPPVDAQTYGAAYYAWNPALHLAGGIGRQYNVGASYHF